MWILSSSSVHNSHLRIIIIIIIVYVSGKERILEFKEKFGMPFDWHTIRAKVDNEKRRQKSKLQKLSR